jgi:tRNA modification GTPase
VVASKFFAGYHGGRESLANSYLSEHFLRGTMLDRLDTTIVAVSSAPGYGRLGIVRLSGPDALRIADAMFTPADGSAPSGRAPSTRVEGEVFIDDELTIPATLYLFRAPRSYTRQDLIEFHTIGSPAALQLVRSRAEALGAVPAAPGEFTARAFLNGAMDLSRAEAIAGIIRAESDVQLRAARRLMEGHLSAAVLAARDELAELAALVEADIDFAEEPIEFITPAELRRRLAVVRASLEELIRGSVSVERFDALPHILLFGAPNAGKSSLMNRLSESSRSICATAAGTTRDILSAPIRVGRGEAVLLDTAGIDKSDDEIIAEARARVLKAAERVDLICVVVDLTSPDDDVFSKALALGIGRIVIAGNKCDLLDSQAVAGHIRRFETQSGGPVIAVSALRGDGIDSLRDALAQALGGACTSVSAESVMMSERQARAVADASAALARAAELSEGASEIVDCAELAAFELREALDLLGGVTGAVTTEDLLGQVFSRFCIGK